MVTLYPSLLAADPLNLQTTLENLNPHADGYHIDIMDNHFVPNLAGSPELIHAIAQQTTRKLWIHLMVDAPQLWPSLLEVPHETIITFHLEATKDPLKLIHAIKRKEWLAGIALKPHTPVDLIYPLMHQIDQLLLMSVEPGFSGQPFLESTHAKIATALRYKEAHNLALHLAIDGGVTKDLLPALVAAGINDIAIGSALFQTCDPATELQTLKQNV